jgi:small-conductance mechanosensitive channel
MTNTCLKRQEPVFMDYKNKLFRLKLSILFTIIVYLPSALVLAVPENTNDWLKQATASIKKYEKLQKRFTNKNVIIETLNTSLKEISQIRNKSQECITETESLLAKTNQDLISLGEATKKENPEVSKKRRDLIKENKELDLKLATCNLLLIQSQDLTKSINQLQQAVIAQQLSARTPHIISVIQETLQSPIASWKETISFFKNQYQKKLLTVKQINLLAALILFSFFIGIFVRQRWLSLPITTQLPSDTLSNFMQSIRYTLIHAIPVLFPMVIMLLFLVIALPLKPLPLITKTSFAIASYISLIVFITVLLHPTPPAQNYLVKSEHLSRKFSFQLKVLLTLAMINFFLTGEFKDAFSEQLYYSSRGVISVLLIINLVSILWLVRNFSWAILSRKPRIFLTLLLFITLVIELAGYRNLSSYILGGLLGTLGAFAFILLIYHLSKDLCDGLDEGRLNWEMRFRKALGLKKQSLVPGLFWIRLIIFVALWGSFSFLFLKIWRLDDPWVAIITSSFTDGFQIGSLTVTPTLLIGGLFSLVLLLNLTRYAKKHFIPNILKHTRLDRGAKEAVTSLLGYAGVTIAILVALSITGVKMQNIAIIAGALSVGIGFGLQNIVNNFISGLILLFERPIRRGDWIITGETEGYVKSINIRSTQIQTFDQADVIVPNSELISAKVTNWMLRNTFGRITIKVGVGYDSDVEKVSRILLDIAHNHPMVMNEKNNQVSPPKVLFRDFGDSALNFELRCFIFDIDQRVNIVSEINFAIVKAFREDNIEIPFPQRVISINNPPEQK